MRNTSNKGIIFENEVAEKLKGMGFVHVKVTKRSRDYGADILAFKDGLDYVFQCKKYSGKVGLKGVQEVSLAMEIYQVDKGYLVCDTTFTTPAIEAVKKSDKPITLVGLEQIKAWKSRKYKHTKYKPLSYQKEILSKTSKHRKKGNSSALLVMATGLGKTLVAAWDLKNQIKKGKKALFLVHRKDILVENSEKFYAIINEKRENYKFGVYFSGKKFKKDDDIVFSTFQTIVKRHTRIPRKYFDYIIIDEAHHSPAKTYAEVLKYFQPKYVLGITATPKRITKADNDFIEGVFGKPLVNLDLAEALTRGYLSPVKYSVFCDNIDYTKLKSVNKKLSVEQLNQTYFIPTKDKDIERIIYSEINRTEKSKTIIFCPTIKYILSVKEIGLFKDAEVYHSNMSDFQRDLIFRRFKVGKINTLLVVDLFNEGIDIPDANIVVFLRTTYSPTIFFQQLGRGLRKDKEKKYLRVLDFVGAISNIKKAINAFGHLLIIQDFVEKVEKQKNLSNIYPARTYKTSTLLDPLELDFYQAGRKVKHWETRFKKKDFLSEMKYLKKQLKKSEGWTEEEIIDELKPICEKLGKFPSQNYLIESGRSDLVAQITYKGSVYYFAEKLGYSTSEKPKKFWKSFKNVEKHLLPICKELNEMPTTDYLKSIDEGGLADAIFKYWGGMSNVGIKIGYKTKTKPTGYWDKFENVKKELLPFCKNGKMPSTTELKENRRDDLVLAVINKHDGFPQIAKKLNLKIKTEVKPKGYWEDVKNLRNELLPIIEDNDNKMPTAGYLEKIGRNDLKIAISRKHGGFPKIGRRMGCYIEKKKPSGYWRDPNNIKKELKSIKNELKSIIDEQGGKVPSTNFLDENYGELLNKIRQIGKYNQVIEMLGYKAKTKPTGYWDKEENIKKELRPISNQLNGKKPSPQYLKDIKRYDVLTAIYKRKLQKKYLSQNN